MKKLLITCVLTVLSVTATANPYIDYGDYEGPRGSEDCGPMGLIVLCAVGYFIYRVFRDRP